MKRICITFCLSLVLLFTMSQNCLAQEPAFREVSVDEAGSAENLQTEQAEVELADGTYLIGITLEGGTGRATVTSPAKMTVADRRGTVSIEWSSPNYDYMKLGDVIYDPVNTDGNSVFELPVMALDEPVEVIADTTAMSQPHEITYTILLDSSTIKEAESGHSISPAIIAAGCAVLIVVVAVLILYRRKRKNHETV